MTSRRSVILLADARCEGLTGIMFRTRSRHSKTTLSLLAFLIGILPLLSAFETTVDARDAASTGSDAIAASCNDVTQTAFANDSRSGAKRLDVLDETTLTVLFPLGLPGTPGSIDRANATSLRAPLLCSGGDRAPPLR